MDSVIAKTRKGYRYQDKLALFEVLERIEASGLEEFYLDYPFESCLSLDIKVVDAGNRVYIYEVKSGITFAENKNTIYEAIVALYEYISSSEENIEGCFLWAHETTTELLQIKARIDHIHENGNKHDIDGKKPIEVADDVIKDIQENFGGAGNFSIQDIEAESFRKFIQNNEVRIEIKDQDNKNVGGTPSKIEREIYNQIDKLAGQHFSEELSVIKNEHIMACLLNVLRDNAGTGKNIVLKIKEELVDHFASRGLLKAKGRDGFSTEEKVQQKERVREMLNIADIQEGQEPGFSADEGSEEAPE